MLCFLSKLFRIFRRQETGGGDTVANAATARLQMPAVMATAVVDILPVRIETVAEGSDRSDIDEMAQKPAARPSSRLLAARLHAVSRLNPPRSQARSKARKSPGANAKPVRKSTETKAKRQPQTQARAPGAILRATAPARSGAEIIDLNAARRARRTAGRKAA